jgi:hypothetical protein
MTAHPSAVCLSAAQLLPRDYRYSCLGGNTSKRFMVAERPIFSAAVFAGEDDMRLVHPSGVSLR